ncbi:MAG: oligopeptide transporter, OPT family [Armatimonadota bacterium]
MKKEKRGLSHAAYEIMPGEEYVPYIPDEVKIKEVTVIAVIMGIILAVIFGMAMTYLGLKVGMTVSASIPAAVISMGILKGIFKRGTILENNFIQTIASAGASLASGLIFTFPALFIWKAIPELSPYVDVNLTHLIVVSIIGSIIGVLFMVPLRRYLIVQEHGVLLYPEGTACAEVLVAGDVGGTPAKLVFMGIFVAALYRFLMSGLKLWTEYPIWSFWKENVEGKVTGLKNAVLSFDILPALLGVGFIIGSRVSALMLGGGILGWFVIIPLISIIGENLTVPIYPATELIKNMGPFDIWSNYLRYIGAGAVAFGGLISLGKAMPTICKSFVLAVEEFSHMVKGVTVATKRTMDDIPMWIIAVGVIIMFFVMVFVPYIPIGWIGAAMVVFFGFFFATVSSRIVGIVGSSSNPVSGMTIGTLIITCIILMACGFKGPTGMIAAIFVGALVCVCICLAGDTSQDLKTGFLVGSTPKYLEVGMMIGALSSALFIGWTISKLNAVYVIGSKELAAPQATLISIVIRGIFESNLPWGLIFAGGAIAVLVELLGASALPVAVGLYLPLELSTPIMVGGLLSYLIYKFNSDKGAKAKIERGVLIASGLIAGDALMGIGVAVIDSQKINLPGMLGITKWIHAENSWVAIGVFAVLVYFLWNYLNKNEDEEGTENKNKKKK